MPRKFQKVVRKGCYKKEVAGCMLIDTPDDVDEECVSTTNKFTEAATQTDHMPAVSKVDVGTQTDEDLSTPNLLLKVVTVGGLTKGHMI